MTLPEPDADGTVRAAVAPPSAGLDRAEGSVPTVAGPVRVSWQRHGRGHGAGPDGAGQRDGDGAAARRRCVRRVRVREGGVAGGQGLPACRCVSAAGGVAVLAVGSGSYRFTSRLRPLGYDEQTVPGGRRRAR